jgi:hypothetical protein
MKPRELQIAIRDAQEIWVFVQATAGHGFYFQIGRKPAKRMLTELKGDNGNVDFHAHLENGAHLILGEQLDVKQPKRKARC